MINYSDEEWRNVFEYEINLEMITNSKNEWMIW